MTDTKIVKLEDLPNYEYPLNVACPTCLKPLSSRKRRDGRCDDCLKDKNVLPINYRRAPKKKVEDDEDYEYEYDED